MNFSLCSRLKKEAELSDPSKSIINQGFCTQMFSTLGKIRAIMPQLLWTRKSGSCCRQCKYTFVVDLMGLNITSKDIIFKKYSQSISFRVVVLWSFF